MVVGNSLRQKRYLDDFPHSPITNLWEDTVEVASQSRECSLCKQTPRSLSDASS